MCREFKDYVERYRRTTSSEQGSGKWDEENSIDRVFSVARRIEEIIMDTDRRERENMPIFSMGLTVKPCDDALKGKSS